MKKKTSLRHSYDHTFFYGLTTAVVNALSTGPILTAFALALGAGNLTLGLLQAVQPISNLIHLPVSYFIEKGRNFKKTAVVSSFIARPFWLIAALTVFFNKNDFALTVFTISYLAAFLIASIAGGVFWPWIKMLVHPRLLNSFFAHRIKYILLTRIVFVGVATGIIWLVQRLAPAFEIYTYAAFFACAFLFGLIATKSLSLIEDKPIVSSFGTPFMKKMAITLKNKSFKTLVVSLSMLNFSLNFLMPFTVVFMLTYLNLSVGATMLFTLLWQLTDSFTITIWSKRTKQKGVNKTLAEAAFCYIIAIVFFILIIGITPTTVPLLFLLTLTHILIGIANAGLNLGINDAAVAYVPKKMASVYIAINNLGRFSGAAAGPLIAGGFLSILADCSETGRWLFFFITGILLFFGSIVLTSKMTQIKENS